MSAPKRKIKTVRQQWEGLLLRLNKTTPITDPCLIEEMRRAYYSGFLDCLETHKRIGAVSNGAKHIPKMLREIRHFFKTANTRFFKEMKDFITDFDPNLN